MPAISRNWDEEIDSAVVVAARGGLVFISTDPADSPRSISFVPVEDVPPGSGDWLPFAGRSGELAADGPTLRVGLGPRDGLSPERVRAAGAAVGTVLAGGSIELDLPELPPELLRALVDGIVASYPGSEPLRLTVPSTALEPARNGAADAEVVRLARVLVNAPANVLTPRRAADCAVRIAELTGLTASVLELAELKAQGFGALLAIGAGSANGPRLVRLEHAGEAGAPVITLVGKGITFDSGGLSLKSPAAMQSMRLDVAGAATVLAVLAGLARRDCPVTVRAVLPFAENLPGPNAARPGDVVTTWSGTQLQILDTDFEGRVVLADALALAASERPQLLVDLATLTYQAEVALGPEIAAVIGPDDGAAAALLAAADLAGEPMWRLPWAPRYLDQVRTPFGVRNHPLHDSGRALTAALFLGEFVGSDVPWVHCDFTGPAWSGNASVDGATGFGARTLIRLIERFGAATTA